MLVFCFICDWRALWRSLNQLWLFLDALVGAGQRLVAIRAQTRQASQRRATATSKGENSARMRISYDKSMLHLGKALLIDWSGFAKLCKKMSVIHEDIVTQFWMSWSDFEIIQEYFRFRTNSYSYPAEYRQGVCKRLLMLSALSAVNHRAAAWPAVY